jgi:hypothetical protein
MFLWKAVMFKNKMIPFALLALSQSILAQQIPSAGSQLQQMPPTPIPQKAGPSVDFKPVAASASTTTDNVKIVVGSLKITGSQAYSEDALIAVSMFKPGSEPERIFPGASLPAGTRYQKRRGHHRNHRGKIRQDHPEQPDKSLQRSGRRSS